MNQYSFTKLLPLLFMLVGYCAQAQITVSAFADKDSICPGDTVHLSCLVSGAASACGVFTASCTGYDKTDSIAPQHLVTNFSNTTSPTVYGNFIKAYRMQFVYRASEIANRFGSDNIIKAINWAVGGFNSNATLQNFTIKIGCISPDSNTISTWKTGLTTVYQASTYTPISGWNNHNLNQYYHWDGISNLVIEVTHYNPATSGSYVNLMAYSNVPQTMLYTSSNTDITNDNSVVPAVLNERPNILMRMCYAPDSVADVTWLELRADSSAVVGYGTSINKMPHQATEFIARIVRGVDTTYSDTVRVILKANQINIVAENNGILCSNDADGIILYADSGFSSYIWSTGSQNTETIVDTPGVFSVSATDVLSGCITKDNVTIVFVRPPVIITSTATSCNVPVTIKVTLPQDSYIWNNDSASQSIVVTQAGLYTVAVTNKGCADTASINVLFYNASFTINPDSVIGNYNYLDAYPDNGVGYWWNTTEDTSAGIIRTFFRTTDKDTLFCSGRSHFWGKGYIRLITSSSQCRDTTYWQQIPYCDLSTDININDEFRTMHIYPNPTEDRLDITLPDEMTTLPVTLQVINATGQVVLSEKINAANINTLNVSTLPKGIYVLLAETDGLILRTNFVKQ